MGDLKEVEDGWGWLVRHHSWAMVELAMALGRLGPETWKLTALGTYGSVELTMGRLLGADDWCARILTGEEIRTSGGEEPRHPTLQ